MREGHYNEKCNCTCILSTTSLSLALIIVRELINYERARGGRATFGKQENCDIKQHNDYTKLTIICMLVCPT
jgi:hypothetical protein